MASQRDEVHQLRESEIHYVAVPCEFELLVKIAKATPPVECTVRLDGNVKIGPEPDTTEQSEFGSMLQSRYSTFKYRISSEGTYNITFNLSYIANITGIKSFRIIANTGKPHSIIIF